MTLMGLNVCVRLISSIPESADRRLHGQTRIERGRRHELVRAVLEGVSAGEVDGMTMCAG